MAGTWMMLYEDALHSDPSELLATIQNASHAMHERLRELGKSKTREHVCEKSAIYRGLSDLYVLNACARPQTYGLHSRNHFALTLTAARGAGAP